MKKGVVSTSRTELATEVYDREAIQSAKWRARATPEIASLLQSCQLLARSSRPDLDIRSGASRQVAQETR
jgi:hypothetical protein